ncbi:MAG: hypothetical protein IT447_14620 [Phycisphaerales bacterium]|jgi:hypothetical protein|nr:hypothetical protein [Phycisphaerales bacterium]
MNTGDISSPAVVDPMGRNTLARTYRTHCRRGAIASVLLNLALLGGLLDNRWIAHQLASPMPFWLGMVWLAGLFAAYAAINFPLDLWFGYLLDRQFGLAKQGIRAWGLDWLAGVRQQAVMFLVGCGLMLAFQVNFGVVWPVVWGAIFLVLLLATACFEARLLPTGLFHVEHHGPQVERILELEPRLPVEVRIYTAPDLRQFNVTMLGLGKSQVLMVSRAAAMLASDELLRELITRAQQRGAKRLPLLTVLLTWVWVMAGVVGLNWILPAENLGLPIYILQMGLGLSVWMLLPQPLTAWFEKRRLGELSTKSRREWIGRNLVRPNPRWFSAGRMYASVCRLSMWVPNLTCRSPSNLLGHPHAWFISSEG